MNWTTLLVLSRISLISHFQQVKGQEFQNIWKSHQSNLSPKNRFWQNQLWFFLYISVTHPNLKKLSHPKKWFSVVFHTKNHFLTHKFNKNGQKCDFGIDIVNVIINSSFPFSFTAGSNPSLPCSARGGYWPMVIITTIINTTQVITTHHTTHLEDTLKIITAI